MKHTSDIKGYHAHLYFDPTQAPVAEAVSAKAHELFGVQVGRLHNRPVGPHPMGSQQLGLSPRQFAGIVPWLALNRRGLDVFIHPVTGNDQQDHTDHVMWLGNSHVLKTELFH